MGTSRRRFLKSAAAVGGVALGHGTAMGEQRATRSESFSVGPVSPEAQLELHAREHLEANATGGAAAIQSDERLPTQAEVDEWYTSRRNWGRWGENDQMGAMNLITPQKRVAAAEFVRTGRTVSISRVFEPAQHFIRKSDRPNSRAGVVVDYYGFIYHGQTITHIDALCHMWDTDGMWQGRDPDVEVTTRGSTFGTIDAWSDGIITRGILIDVPRLRAPPTIDGKIGEGE